MRRRRWLRALRIEVIHLKPGDVLVVSTDHTLDQDGAAEVSRPLTARFPDNKHFVLPAGWSVQPVRSQEALNDHADT